MRLPSPGCLAAWRANLPPLRERWILFFINIFEPTRPLYILHSVFCFKKKYISHLIIFI